MANKWQSKVDALILLAEDQAGKPEGNLAKEKLHRILRRFPELAHRHDPLADYADRTFTVGDLRQMEQRGISTSGEWTGRNLNEAVAMMIADYKQRAWGRRVKQLSNDVHKMKYRFVVDMSLGPLVVKIEQVTNGIRNMEISGKNGTFRLFPFRRVSGSVYTSMQYIQLEAWAAFVPNSTGCEQQQLGPGIKIRATLLPRGRTRVDIECCYPFFLRLFRKLFFALSNPIHEIARLERELEALEPRMIEAGQ